MRWIDVCLWYVSLSLEFLLLYALECCLGFVVRLMTECLSEVTALVSVVLCYVSNG